MNTKNKTEETTVKTEYTREPDQSDTGQQTAITMDFTDAELETLSNGILSLLRNIPLARPLVPDEKVQTAIDGYCTELQSLNTKICRCIRHF